MAFNDENGTIGITGASGQLGRRVLELLTERAGGERVVAITRSPEKLADLAAKGIEVRTGDFTKTDDLAAAFAGIYKLYLISVDDIREGVRALLHGNAIRAAKQAGVQHIIYSSAIKPQFSPIQFLHDHAVTEQMVVESGLAYTFLRNSFYLEVVLQSGVQALAGGSLFSAAQGGAIAYVSREDSARAAAAVLTSSGHEGAIYDITGSYAWTQEEIAAELGKFAGRKLNFVELPADVLRQGMVANGLPAPLVEMLINIDHGVARGALDVVSRAVARLTGTPPETLPQFLARHQDTFSNTNVA